MMKDGGSDHGCIYGIFRKIYPIAVTIPNVLNSYTQTKKTGHQMMTGMESEQTAEQPFRKLWNSLPMGERRVK